MGSFKRPNAFDPIQLEMIEQAYEAAWAEIVAREPFRDVAQDEKRKAALRIRMFAYVCYGVPDVTTLRDKMLASMWEYWASPTEPLTS